MCGEGEVGVTEAESKGEKRVVSLPVFVGAP